MPEKTNFKKSKGLFWLIESEVLVSVALSLWQHNMRQQEWVAEGAAPHISCEIETLEGEGSKMLVRILSGQGSPPKRLASFQEQCMLGPSFSECAFEEHTS